MDDELGKMWEVITEYGPPVSKDTREKATKHLNDTPGLIIIQPVGSFFIHLMVLY